MKGCWENVKDVKQNQKNKLGVLSNVDKTPRTSKKKIMGNDKGCQKHVKDLE
jgi:hypothetical protein